MLVSDILNEKGRNVVTASSEQTVRDVITSLSDHRIGALVLVDGSGQVEGILSERDIVLALAREGAQALDRTAAEIMTRRVVSCKEADTVQYLMEQMTEGRFRHLPVMADGELRGIVSIGDVVKHRLKDYELETQAMREYITMA